MSRAEPACPAAPVCPLPAPPRYHDLRKIPFDDRQVLEREVVHFCRKKLHPIDEVVIEDHRGDGGGKTGGGRNERFADARRDDTDVRGLHRADSLKGVHDSPRPCRRVR